MSSLMLNRRILACLAISVFLVSTLMVPAAHAETECTITDLTDGSGYHYTATLANPTPEELPIGSVVVGTGCDIGIYFDEAGSMIGVEVYGANHYGIVNYGAAVDITGSNIHDNGDLYGIYFAYGTGTIDGNIVSGYQVAGIYIGSGSVATVTNNVVTGLGPNESVAQSGIRIGHDASGYLKGNEVSGNWYIGSNPLIRSSGILSGYTIWGHYSGAASLIAKNNNIHDNQVSILVYGDDNIPPYYQNTCTLTQLLRNNIHHSETGILLDCFGPAEPLTIEDNNIHHNTDPLNTVISDPYKYDVACNNHLHQNKYELLCNL